MGQGDRAPEGEGDASESGSPSPQATPQDPSSGGSDDSLLRAVAEIPRPSFSEVQACTSGAFPESLGAGAIVAKRYRLERLVGRGGMGVVWEAIHLVTRRRVAIKFVTGPAHQQADRRRRFLREARAASRATHPNVVEVLDVFELDDGTPVMVMELLSGETLRDRLVREGCLSLAVTASLFLPVLAAVQAAHALGVVHRDLKPENVFLVDGKEPGRGLKVLDFGVAKLTGHGEEPLEAASLTSTGSTLGTPGYMAPEQATGEKDIDARADVWALGVMLYECLAGARPIEGSGVGQIVMNLMTEGIKPLGGLVRDLPPEVEAVVMRMLTRARDDRPRNLREVIAVLAQFTDVRPPAPKAISNPAWRAPNRSAIAFSAAAGLSLLVGGWRAIASHRPTVARENAQSPASAPALLASSGSPAADATEASPASVIAVAPAPTRGTPSNVAGTSSPPIVSGRKVTTPKPGAASAAVASSPGVAEPLGAPPPTSSAPTPPGADCDPPYEFDRQGRKTWKRQCL